MSFHAIAGTVLSGNTHHAPVRERIAAAIRRALGASKSPAKELARATGRTPKGAELLLRGDVTPSAETLIALCREYDEVWAEFKELCGRASDVAEAEAIVAEFTERLRRRRAA